MGAASRDPMPEKTVVVIPTYNEAANLPPMVEALLALPVPDLHILIVDDNSPDGTGAVADRLRQAYPDRMQALHRPAKEGIGRAYIAGFKAALQGGATRIIQMDADFSHDPQAIPSLLTMSQRYDLVIGSRWIAGASIERSWGIHRKLLSMFANRLYVPLLLGFPVQDATSGYRCWRRHTLQALALDRIKSNGYVFQVEMCYVAHRLGFGVAEMPIHFAERRHGASKMGGRILVEAALSVWKMRWKYRHPALTRAAEE